MRFLVVVFCLSLSACGSIQAGKIMDGIGTAIDVAETVCSVAPLFNRHQKAQPAVKACDTYISEAARLKQDERVQTFVEVARCVQRHREDPEQMGICVDAVKGWEFVLKEL
jgi:hypothetical protein